MFLLPKEVSFVLSDIFSICPKLKVGGVGDTKKHLKFKPLSSRTAFSKYSIGTRIAQTNVI